MLGMFRHSIGKRAAAAALRTRRIALFGSGFLLCGTVLVVTVLEKFAEAVRSPHW